MTRPAILLLLLLAGAAPAPVPDYRVPGSLAEAAPEDPARIDALVTTVRSGTAREAQDAWRMLAGFGRPAAPTVIRGLVDAPWYARANLVTALAESGVDEVAPVLLAAAADPSWAVRAAAAAGLSRSPAAGTLDALTTLAGDPSWRVRTVAARSIRVQASRGQLDRASAIAALLPLAEDEDEDVRRTAVRQLGLLRADEGRPYFEEQFLDEDAERDRRREALDFLTRLEGGREELLVALEAALGSSDNEFFLEAAKKYAKLTGGKILEDEARTERLLDQLKLLPLEASKVFAEIGRPAVPLLLEFLRKIYRSPGRMPPMPGDLTQVVLRLVQKILAEDAAPVLREIITKWDESAPARRYAVLLARQFHAEALFPTLCEAYGKESYYDIRASLLLAIAASSPPELVDYLKKALRSGSRSILQAAHRILLSRPDIDLSSDLVAAVRAEGDDDRAGDRQVADWWLGLLWRRRDPAVYELAREMIDRDDPDFRELGAEWIRVGLDVDEVLDQLGRALAAEDGRDRGAGEPGIGETEEDADRSLVVRHRVVGTILDSARRRAGARAIPLLAKALEDPDPVVREKALEQIGKIDSPEALRVAAGAWETETEPTPRRAALRAIVRYDTPEVTALLTERLTGEDEDARLRVLNALYAVKEGPVPAAVLEALADGLWEPGSRVRAAEVVAERRDPAHLPLLARLAAEDPDGDVRREAIQALGDIGDPRGVPVLLSLLPPEGKDLRDLSTTERGLAADAVEALGYIGAADSGPRILGLLGREWPLALSDATPDRRHFHFCRYLITALGRSRDERAIVPLLRLLFTPELWETFSRISDGPRGGANSVLGTLVAAIVRFPDASLAPAAAGLVAELRRSGEAYLVNESYLVHVARIVADPRREQLHLPLPRRGLAAELIGLVPDIAPRESAADLAAREMLTDHLAGSHAFAAGAESAREENLLRRIVDPLGFAEREAYWLSQADYLEGLALIEAGRVEEGKEIYARGVQRDADDADVLNSFAWWLAVTGHELPGALNAALAAGRRDANAPYIMDTLGWVLFRLGRYAEAAEQLRVAVLLDAEQAERDEATLSHPLYRWHLAAALSMAGFLEAGEETGETGATEVLGQAIRQDDTIAGFARSSPWFQPLRDAGLLEPVIEEALSSIPR